MFSTELSVYRCSSAFLVAAALTVCAAAHPRQVLALGVRYYVNGATGDDTWDGLCETSDGGTSGPKRTIGAGIEAAADGDEVVVAPGTYTGDGNQDLDPGTRAITIRSTNPADPAVVAATIIDCGGSAGDPHSAFTFYGGGRAVVDGFTIIRGWVGDYGGGIYSQSSAATISRCVLRDNYSRYYGGAICAYSDDMTITDCVIESNRASQYGAGIFCYFGKPQIVRCAIVGNTADQAAGAVFCWTASPAISRCRIQGNSATYWGGGLFCHGSSNPTIADCLITGNTSREAGAAYCYMSHPFFVNCTIAGNDASSSGGGILCQGGLTVANCILWGNTAPAGHEFTVRASSTYASRAFVRYSDVQGGRSQAAVDATSLLDWGAGNRDEPPLFVDADGADNDAATWQDNDFRLLPGSPCIDVGWNADVPASATTDVGGNPRFADGDGDGAPTVDLGAVELPRPVAGDVDCDADVDLTDYLAFAACFNGANRPAAAPACGAMDFDRDVDVDLNDFLTFQGCFNGPNLPAACSSLPSVACPPGVEVDATGERTIVALGTPTATDALGTPLVPASDAPADGFTVGRWLVTWWAADRYGLTAECRQPVAVRGQLVTTATGLKYQDFVIGTGLMPVTNATVHVKYVGTLENGTQFDAREWAEFPLLGVVPGFAEGIRSMRVGGQRRLVIPPALGYGNNPPAGSGIPPGATLIFVVDLLGVR